MDPLTLTTAVAGLIGTSFTLGNRLHSLYDQYCAALKEFEAFGREVKALGGTWQMVQPCLEDTQPLLSLNCLQTLTNICNGTNDILKDVTETVEISQLKIKRTLGRRNGGQLLVFYVSETNQLPMIVLIELESSLSITILRCSAVSCSMPIPLQLVLMVIK